LFILRQRSDLDEVFLTITGRRHYLWRAVDQDGNVLDILGPTSPGCQGRQAVLP
jgi:DDE domain